MVIVCPIDGLESIQLVSFGLCFKCFQLLVKTMDGDGGDGYGNQAADGPPEPDCPERKMVLRILLYFMVCVTLAIYVWQLLYDALVK